MIKANVMVGKKVPIEGVPYSNHDFHIEVVEGEFETPEDIGKLYERLNKIVDEKLGLTPKEEDDFVFRDGEVTETFPVPDDAVDSKLLTIQAINSKPQIRIFMQEIKSYVSAEAYKVLAQAATKRLGEL